MTGITVPIRADRMKEGDYILLHATEWGSPAEIVRVDDPLGTDGFWLGCVPEAMRDEGDSDGLREIGNDPGDLLDKVVDVAQLEANL